MAVYFLIFILSIVSACKHQSGDSAVQQSGRPFDVVLTADSKNSNLIMVTGPVEGDVTPLIRAVSSLRQGNTFSVVTCANPQGSPPTPPTCRFVRGQQSFDVSGQAALAVSSLMNALEVVPLTGQTGAMGFHNVRCDRTFCTARYRRVKHDFRFGEFERNHPLPATIANIVRVPTTIRCQVSARLVCRTENGSTITDQNALNIYLSFFARLGGAPTVRATVARDRQGRPVASEYLVRDFNCNGNDCSGEYDQDRRGPAVSIGGGL